MTRILVTILGSVWFLYGCGFSPMYGDLGDGSQTISELDAIEISTASNEIGSRIQNELGDLLHGGGAPTSSKYVLEINASSNETKSGYRVDASVTRAQITLKAHYRLVDNQTGEVLLSNERTETTSIDVLRSQFATIVSRDSALDRATKELSQFIQADLSVYFENQKSLQAKQTAIPPKDPS